MEQHEAEKLLGRPEIKGFLAYPISKDFIDWAELYRTPELDALYDEISKPGVTFGDIIEFAKANYGHRAFSSSSHLAKFIPQEGVDEATARHAYAVILGGAQGMQSGNRLQQVLNAQAALSQGRGA